MKHLRKLALLTCIAALAAVPATYLTVQAADDSAQTKPAKRTSPVDINSASSDELQTLKGIDSAAADKIIAGRPYASITQLVSKNVLTKAAFDDIRKEIVAKKVEEPPSNKKNNKSNKNSGKPNKGGRRK